MPVAENVLSARDHVQHLLASPRGAGIEARPPLGALLTSVRAGSCVDVALVHSQHVLTRGLKLLEGRVLVEEGHQRTIRTAVGTDEPSADSSRDENDQSSPEIMPGCYDETPPPAWDRVLSGVLSGVQPGRVVRLPEFRLVLPHRSRVPISDSTQIARGRFPIWKPTSELRVYRGRYWVRTSHASSHDLSLPSTCVFLGGMDAGQTPAT